MQKITLHSRIGAGFFAELYSVFRNIVDVLSGDFEGREIEVMWNEEFFPYNRDQYENGWPLFFYPIGQVRKLKNIDYGVIIHDQNCLNKWLQYDNFYDYRFAMHKLINKYIKVKQEILNEVENYYNTHMSRDLCIGIHVRFSSAHVSENPGPITLTDYFNEIDLLIKNISQSYKIYLATDSNYVVQQFKQRYKNVLLYIDAIRGSYKEEVHLIYDNPDYWLKNPKEFQKQKPGYKGGKDALLDCLLLSRCTYLIHSTSNLSDFATFFNPEIKSIFVPRNIGNKVKQCILCDSANKWYQQSLDI